MITNHLGQLLVSNTGLICVYLAKIITRQGMTLHQIKIPVSDSISTHILLSTEELNNEFEELTTNRSESARMTGKLGLYNYKFSKGKVPDHIIVKDKKGEYHEI